MTASDRSDRTAAADALCVAAFERTGAPVVGVCLVAVGGYGRRELAPASDLDVVLVHDDGVDLGRAAADLWYPLWDSGSRLDHSVRSLSEMVRIARGDLKVALGLLDVRHLAGDPALTLRLRTTMLTEWRRDARGRLPELRDLVRSRHELIGELAHLSVPDVKEAGGGLRDATVLKALVASWLVDVPHVELERSRGPCSTSATCSTRSPGAPPTGSPRRPGPTWPGASGSRTTAPPRSTSASSAAGSTTCPA